MFPKKFPTNTPETYPQTRKTHLFISWNPSIFWTWNAFGVCSRVWKIACSKRCSRMRAPHHEWNIGHPKRKGSSPNRCQKVSFRYRVHITGYWLLDVYVSLLDGVAIQGLHSSKIYVQVCNWFALNLWIATLGGSFSHIDRAIGAHPTISHMKGWFTQ